MDRFLYCTHATHVIHVGINQNMYTECVCVLVPNVPFKLFTGYSYCINKFDLNAMNACFVQSMTSLQLLSRPNRTASTSWRESLLCTTRPSTHTTQDSEDMSTTFVCMQDILQCVCVCVCVCVLCTRFLYNCTITYVETSTMQQ